MSYRNLQKPQKYVKDPNLLAVHKIFPTIQGEGPFCGMPAIFIRLAGCNLQCPACDTDYRMSYEIPPSKILTIIEKISPNPKLVVITGGEPFRQNLSILIPLLTYKGYIVQIESNGSLPPPKEVKFEKDPFKRKGAYIVCSPKTASINITTALNSCAFKYVVHYEKIDKEDGLPITALDHPCKSVVARPPAGFKGLIYIQPEDSGNKEINYLNRSAAIQYCFQFGYLLQLQIHKIIGVE